ncbi:MAG: hypothetical protein KC635_28355, partial [Myxococcales bacterium]|nr:hypothetical protein [Myxococcales bacterium]
ESASESESEPEPFAAHPSLRGDDVPIDPEAVLESAPSLAATLAFAMARLERVHQDHVATVERLVTAREGAERIRADLRAAEVMANLTEREREGLATELRSARDALERERGRREVAERVASLPWYAFRQRRELRERLDRAVQTGPAAS